MRYLIPALLLVSCSVEQPAMLCEDLNGPYEVVESVQANTAFELYFFPEDGEVYHSSGGAGSYIVGAHYLSIDFMEGTDYEFTWNEAVCRYESGTLYFQL